MAEIALSNIAGGGGGGLTQVLQQNATLTTGQTDITVTENGGVLPTSDAGVLVSSATGAIQQGVAAQEYQINRGVVPNLIELNTPVLGTLDFVLFLIYS